MHQQEAAGAIWLTSQWTVVNAADGVKYEALNEGEGESRGNEDQLNTDCTSGDKPKNNPSISLCWHLRVHQTESCTTYGQFLLGYKKSY